MNACVQKFHKPDPVRELMSFSGNENANFDRLEKAISNFQLLQTSAKERIRTLYENRKKHMRSMQKCQIRVEGTEEGLDGSRKKELEMLMKVEGAKQIVKQKKDGIQDLMKQIAELMQQKELLTLNLEEQETNLEILQIEQQNIDDEMELMRENCDEAKDQLEEDEASIQTIDEDLSIQQKLLKDAKEKQKSYQRRMELLQKPNANYLLNLNHNSTGTGMRTPLYSHKEVNKFEILN